VIVHETHSFGESGENLVGLRSTWTDGDVRPHEGCG
jgi:hypothetical protein